MKNRSILLTLLCAAALLSCKPNQAQNLTENSAQVATPDSLQATGQGTDEAIVPYFSTKELPDLIRCLPAPPDTADALFAYDVYRYQWGKERRSDTDRAAIAIRDAVWNYDALLAEFWEPFGLNISRENTPQIWKWLEESLTTTDQMRVAPKAYYHRERPFEHFREAMLTGEESTLSGEGSYPSGHTMRGWTVAMLLSELNPAKADALFARGWTYGESRVIAGAHWQSDVDISRIAAGIGVSALHASPGFRAQGALARAEYRRLTGCATPAADGDFVAITDIIPDAILEIRYYSTYNFVGARIDGYEEPTALLTAEAATALKKVSDDLAAQGYRIKIFDAYRPQCAVDHFVRWAADVDDTLMKACFYPDLDKSVLFQKGFIAKKSGHTRGSTVDLTLVEMLSGKEVDMGFPFDWFGGESHPSFCGNPDTGVYTGDNSASSAGRKITPEQFRSRIILRRAMLRHGFKPLSTEWWHFTLADEPYKDRYFTRPVAHP